MYGPGTGFGPGQPDVLPLSSIFNFTTRQMIEGEGFFLQNQAGIAQAKLTNSTLIVGVLLIVWQISFSFRLSNKICKRTLTQVDKDSIEMAGKEFKVLESLDIDISKLCTLDDTCIFHVLKDAGLQTGQCVSVLSKLRAPSAEEHRAI